MILDTALARRSNFIRKGFAYALQAPRTIRRSFCRPSEYQRHPPIVVNSVPKSGTHLLMQVARALPGNRYYGSFLAQYPSLTMRPRSQPEINFHLTRAVPGEVMGAHLHYSEHTEKALSRINALHLFIYRDPRDVLISEANYLASMNRWHAMHNLFSRFDTEDARVELAIVGCDKAGFPNVKARLYPYLQWLGRRSVIAIRYEDMVGPQALAVLDRVLDEWRQRGGLGDVTSEALLAAINPEKSHTYHSGGIEKWRSKLSAENKALFAANAEDLAIAYGFGATFR